MTGTWTAGAVVDRASGYVVTTTVWNQLMGATGNLLFLYENAGPRGIIGMIEEGAYKAPWFLGAPQSSITFADNSVAGPGTQVHIATAGTVARGTAASGYYGTWQMQTSATGNGEVGHVGPSYVNANDWTSAWRGILPSNAEVSVNIGGNSVEDAQDQNNCITMFKNGTANVIFKSDSGGTETTRDSGAAGSAEHTERIVNSAAGTSISCYYNNAIVGAVITTNIPTAELFMVALERNLATTDSRMNTADWGGVREAG